MFNFNSEGPGPNSMNSAAPSAKRTSSAAPAVNSVGQMNLLAHQRQMHQQQRVKVPMPHQHHPSASSSSTFMPPLVANPLSVYKARKDRERVRVLDKYEIVGYIAAGTYGRVYKAKAKKNSIRPVSGSGVYAIKKFKADKEGEVVNYTGISQSACREMSLCRELNHRNITNLVETILEDKSIYMVFDYAEHDLLQIIHYHSHPERRALPESVFKSIMWQLLNGVSYLHQNWVLHRDLKPANIMVTSDGTVKIGDLGLARLFNDPLQSLFAGDKVVVTIWYRAPELLLGARHYTPAIDMWAVGCIFAELLSLRPIFKGEEAKMDKKNVPFQRNQTQKVMEILGTPHPSKWPSLPKYPEYSSLQTMKQYANVFEQWYHNIGRTNRNAFQLLCQLLEYDPSRRIAAHDALVHAYFTADKPAVSQNVFEGQKYEYPARRISVENIDIKSATFTTGVKRTAAAVSTDHDSGLNPRKKQK